MKIHVILHESFESPAAIETWARDRDHDITYTRLYNGETFPAEHHFDFFVI